MYCYVHWYSLASFWKRAVFPLGFRFAAPLSECLDHTPEHHDCKWNCVSTPRTSAPCRLTTETSSTTSSSVISAKDDLLREKLPLCTNLIFLSYRCLQHLSLQWWVYGSISHLTIAECVCHSPAQYVLFTLSAFLFLVTDYAHLL